MQKFKDLLTETAGKKLNFRDAQAQMRNKGMVLTKNEDGEYRINYKGGREDTAYYTDDLQDAVDTGCQMEKEREKANVEEEVVQPESRYEVAGKRPEVPNNLYLTIGLNQAALWHATSETDVQDLIGQHAYFVMAGPNYTVKDLSKVTMGAWSKYAKAAMNVVEAVSALPIFNDEALQETAPKWILASTMEDDKEVLKIATEIDTEMQECAKNHAILFDI